MILCLPVIFFSQPWLFKLTRLTFCHFGGNSFGFLLDWLREPPESWAGKIVMYFSYTVKYQTKIHLTITQFVIIHQIILWKCKYQKTGNIRFYWNPFEFPKLCSTKVISGIGFPTKLNLSDILKELLRTVFEKKNFLCPN